MKKIQFKKYKTTLFFMLKCCVFVVFFQQFVLNAQQTLAEENAPSHLDSTKILAVKSPSGIDTTITFYAKDTVIYKLREKKMLLQGNAKINLKNQNLEAEIIEVDFEKSLLHAKLGKDSAGKIIGIPKFNDNGEEFFAEELTYNLKTKTGIIKSGETKMGEGFYYGDSIRRVSETELYVKNGYYTTCDAAEPHYHFGSSEMKMLVGDRIFADPLYLYVEDIPIFVIPFGLFLPISHGRSSGLIVPSFYFSNSRGVVFQNFGFYWAASDYWDAKITADLYTKGGYLLNLANNWVLKDVFSGNGQFSFGKTRYSLDEEYSQEWSLRLNHEHIFTPFERANINLDFASQDFNRNTSTNLSDRVKQNATSRASYSRTFENGINASISFSNDQNIITNEYSGSVPLSVSVPQFQPIKKLFDVPLNSWYSWVRDITFRYSGNAYYNFDKRLTINSYFDNSAGKIIYDTVFNSNASKYIAHSPQISISPKLGYFTVTPSVTFNANNYFRKLNKTYNPSDSSVVESFSDGFFNEYNYAFGIGISTRIYGIADEKKKLFGFINPNSLGIKAARHSYQPSVNFSYAPDFSAGNYDFYGKYFDELTGREVTYSRFEKEGGSHASQQLQKRLSYSDVHSFEIKKRAPGDSLPDENLELLRLSLSGSYNFAADSLKFSDIGMNFRTPALKFMEFSGQANFTLYDEVKVKNGTSNYEYFTKVNQFLLENGKGLARLTNLGFNISAAFSSEGLVDVSSYGILENEQDSLAKDSSSTELGSKFITRSESPAEDGDLFGLNSPGFSSFHLPWSINLGLTFNYNHTVIDRISRSLNFNLGFNFTLAETWKISTNLQYDFINMRLITPEISLNKDLHCWDLRASWYPSGYNQGFYLRFGIKSAQLQDLKIEKRDSPVFR